MSEEKVAHTKGPWTMERNGGTRVPFRVIGDEYLLGEIYQADGAAEANARLIAAAPDLVAALRECVTELRMLNVNERGEQRKNTPAAIRIRDAEAALRKAGA